ncbi:uncharacterized protein EI97DRAFT_440217 [Westerdykella ornata]|uniref:Uncharacterized protein n=1 Tax=Westerdykella ornata TaxID=318751 RepID=A0A6A6JQZ2_WESOR|nr:uncharacterized protein EI97DRAFT_440217 [Westerdykella ornata]KAF2278685.1 hypothetical protein EI97DRAFT_440217 [Westerdykella ornata]
MADLVPLFHTWRGSHTSRSGPKMRDCKRKVLDETRAQLAQNLASEPGVAYVRYNNHIQKVAPHGTIYTFSGKEEPVYSDEDSHRDSHGWRGTVTCELTAYFRVREVSPQS